MAAAAGALDGLPLEKKPPPPPLPLDPELERPPPIRALVVSYIVVEWVFESLTSWHFLYFIFKSY